MIYRKGSAADLEALKQLALASWSIYQNDLTEENWKKLQKSLQSDETYLELLRISYPLICENKGRQIIGMAFLVPGGNPTEIYEAGWSYIRFVTVHPEYKGKGIGKELTKQCIDLAKQNNEQFIALHTSEMMASARQLYEHLGFRMHRELPARLGKKYWLYLLNLA